MGAIDELLARHSASQNGSRPPQLPGARPKLRTAVVTCMDARIDLFQTLDLQLGDVHMLRNAGGIVTDDVLRSLVVSQRMLGTEEVMVVQHSRCGLHGLRDAELAGRVEAETGEMLPFAIGGFEDLAASVKTSVQRLRDCAWLPSRDAVRGFVYDVEAASITEVA